MHSRFTTVNSMCANGLWYDLSLSLSVCLCVVSGKLRWECLVFSYFHPILGLSNKFQQASPTQFQIENMNRMNEWSERNLFRIRPMWKNNKCQKCKCIQFVSDATELQNKFVWLSWRELLCYYVKLHLHRIYCTKRHRIYRRVGEGPKLLTNLPSFFLSFPVLIMPNQLVLWAM